MSLGSSNGCGVYNMSLFNGQTRQVSPYLDYATRAVPNSFADVLDWSEMAASMSSDLGTGLRHLYTYFATQVDIEATGSSKSSSEQANSVNWSKAIERDLNYLNEVTQVGINTGVYGNDFVTIMLKHRRFLRCPRCQWQLNMKEVRQFPAVEFDFGDMVFSGYCQARACKGMPRIKFELEHVYDRQLSNIWFKHWPIRELDFDFADHTDSLQIYWRIPNRIKTRLIKDKDVLQLHDVDLSVLRCACENRLLEFDDSVMFHAKEPQLSGMENRGLGVPRTLVLAKPDWTLQMLKKQCQAVAKSYLLPMEFFSLETGTSGMGSTLDPIQQSDARLFANFMEQMIRSHSIDPTRKHIVPFPVKHQMAGGGGDQFVPTQLLQLYMRDLSNKLVPMAMLNGDLTVQGAPMFLRMFEAMNREIPSLYNRFLGFVVSRVAMLMRCSPIEARHQSASIADNLSVDGMLMQGAQMGSNSNYSWMRRIGTTPAVESQRKYEEARQQMEFQQKVQELEEEFGFSLQIAQQASAGIMAAAQDPAQQQGGAPAGGGGAEQPMAGPAPGAVMLPSQGFQPSNDIENMQSESEQLAQMLGDLPPQQRQQELTVLRTNNKAFHSMVTAALEQYRSDVASQARAQAAPNL